MNDEKEKQPDGRKIPKIHENPIDNILIDGSIVLGKVLSKFSFFTPNVFTTISLIISLVGIYYIHNKDYRIGAILIFIGYFFDALDGNFARIYKMTSKYGDYYDHISDVSKFILLFFVILLSKLKTNTKILFYISFVILYLLSFIHLGCQEKFYNKSSSLDILKSLCGKKENIIYTRYFGLGTTELLKLIFLYNMKYINNFL